MRFTAFFTVMAAGSAIASYQPPDEETTTLTSTTTHYVTVTKCADNNPDCPLNQPSTSEAPAQPTYEEPAPSYPPVPTPEPETSSEIVIVETSSALPQEPSSSSVYYPIHNTTSHAGSTPSASVPVVTSLQTEVVQPSPSSEPSQVAGSGAAGLSLQGGVLAGMVAISLAALF